MKHVLGALAFALLCLTTSAMAQTAVTVAASSAQMVAGNLRQTLSICNQSATASISVCFADNTGSCTAILNTAGQYMIPALQCLAWRAEDRPPPSAIFGIASAGSTPVTVTQR